MLIFSVNHYFAVRVVRATVGALAGLCGCLAAVAAQPLTADLAAMAGVPDPAGIVFQCPEQQLTQLRPELDQYLQSIDVDLTRIAQKLDLKTNTLSYSLAEPLADGITLDLIDRQALGLTEELVALPTAKKAVRTVLTVSKKEIVYAMLQVGRTSLFSSRACNVQALRDQVGIRQNVVAWTESLNWGWPNGGSAKWNTKYWRRGNPVKGYSLHEAVNDAFIHQERYAVGCYTATKLVMLQAVLDYYHRVKQDPATLAVVQARLLQDGDPLSYLEPGAMWSFESDSTELDRARPGKLLQLQHGISAKNFIPGDWSYFLNTDSATYKKTGYEGSNAVYLGRGLFDDYYNDHHHSYTYKEKMNEVYQWRNKVFSRSRDVAKMKPLSAVNFEALGRAPEVGGLALDLRAVPLIYGFQDLPLMPF